MDEITKKNFGEQAVRFCKARGLENGSFPVIDRSADPEAWLHWMVYFGELDMKASVSEMAKAWWAKSGTWTVPSRLPEQFDLQRTIDRTQVEALREYLDRYWTANEELTLAGRKKAADDILAKVRGGLKPMQQRRKAHDQRGEDLEQIRKAVLDQNSKPDRGSVEQQAAEREAVDALMRRTGGAESTITKSDRRAVD